jgi:hypothetical protein
MAQEMFDEGLMDAAQSWAEIAEEKYEQSSTNDDTTEEDLCDLKKDIQDYKVAEEGKVMFENLCKRLGTGGHDETFKNSSTSCRYVQEGKNPFFVKKLEELSKEPIVNVIHDFLTKEEVQDVLNESAGYKFKSARTVADFNEVSEYAGGRVATSYYVDEEEDSLGHLTNRIKNR